MMQRSQELQTPTSALTAGIAAIGAGFPFDDASDPSYDPLFGIDLLGELDALSNPADQQQLQQQQQQQIAALDRPYDIEGQQRQLYHQAFPPDSSDGSCAVSLSPLSTCSSCMSPQAATGQQAYHSQHHQHHQVQQQYPHQQLQQRQQQPPSVAPSLIEDPDDLLFLADGVSPLPAVVEAPTELKLEPVDHVSLSGEGSTAGKSQQQRHHQRDDKICGVCGDKALGFNFDAVSCESCKAFFRRNAGKGVDALKCPYSYNCAVDVSNRRFCKRCRLQKCFDIGMKKEFILTEQEKMDKRKKIDQNKLQRTLESLHLLPKDLSPTELADREMLTEAELTDVKFLLDCYAASEVVKAPERQGRRAVSVDDLINFAELSALRVVDMCKKLPEFQNLSPPDKLLLLKGGAMELILLRGVISFDPERARFLDSGDSESADVDAMDGSDFLKAAGSSGYAFLQLARSLCSGLQCDRATLILLLVVCLFSADRPGLTPDGAEHVEAAQIRFSLLLDRLLRCRLPSRDARRVYPQLLTQLAELRALEKDFSDLARLSDPRFLSPLMAEFLDIQETQQQSGGGKHSPY